MHEIVPYSRDTLHSQKQSHEKYLNFKSTLVFVYNPINPNQVHGSEKNQNVHGSTSNFCVLPTDLENLMNPTS